MYLFFSYVNHGLTLERWVIVVYASTIQDVFDSDTLVTFTCVLVNYIFQEHLLLQHVKSLMLQVNWSMSVGR